MLKLVQHDRKVQLTVYYPVRISWIPPPEADSCLRRNDEGKDAGMTRGKMQE
jgi:hypothetical protein